MTITAPFSPASAESVHLQHTVDSSGSESVEIVHPAHEANVFRRDPVAHGRLMHMTR
jgi:hypothetical protein